MKMVSVSLTKHLKVGMPNYSNISIGTTIAWEMGEGEEFKFDKGWDILNRQLQNQANQGTDPAWIQTKEYDKHYSTVIKHKKTAE